MDRVTLWVYFDSKWYIHDSFTNLTTMVHAIRQLCQNPDVLDFRVQPY